MHVFLALGSNLGDRDMNLVQARDRLMKHDVLVLRQSEVLETKPLEDVEQPYYLNQVVECQTDLSPQELLRVVKTVEKEMGRPVELPTGGAINVHFGQSGQEERWLGREWEARIIDIDILFYEDWVVNQPDLRIPHSEITNRDFILKGVLDLDPDFVHPVLKKPLKAFLPEA